MHEVEVVATDPAAERSDRRDVVADAEDEPTEQVQGWPDGQNEQKQQQSQQQVGLTQPLHSLVHPRDHRGERDGRDDNDQHHLGGVGRRHAEQMVQPRRRLLGPQAERCREPEERGKHGEDVDEVAGPPPHCVT